MKEDLNINGDEYNRFTTYWTVGYLVGQIPSQLVVTKGESHPRTLQLDTVLRYADIDPVRPSIWLPCAELAWTIITFLFATVSKVEHIYGMRFLVGVCESPFYVGVISVLGSWYTPRGRPHQFPNCIAF